jgi:demethylspheroidene O-methyltransferase
MNESSALASPRPAAGPGWRGWLQRQISNPRFRRWAAGFWLTRPLVRRRAGQLFDLVAGFVYTQVLLACVRLDLFDRLAAMGAGEVALTGGTD